MESCTTSLNLTPFQLKRINGWIKNNPQTYSEKIRKNFTDDAEHIIEIAKRVISEKRSEITPQDLEISFVKNVDQNVDKVENKSFASDIPEVNYGGDPGAYNRMRKKFTDAIVEASIFNKKYNKIIKPFAEDPVFENALNRNIFNFKMDLIKTLAYYTHMNVETEYKSPQILFQTIQDVLSAFNGLNTKQLQLTEQGKFNTVSAYTQALDAYTILSNFDRFLKDFAPFVKVKDGFEEYEAPNRYEYVGPTTHMRNTYIGDTEDKGNMDDNISDLAEILLNYFPEYNSNGPLANTQISKAGFSQVMTAFKDWVDTVPFNQLINDTTKNEQEIANSAQILLNAFYNGNDAAIQQLFNLFVSKAKLNLSEGIDKSKFSLNKLLGISAMFGLNLPKPISRMFWNLAFKTSANIGKSASFYNGIISNKQLRDGYKSEQWAYIQDSIQTAVNQFYENPELYNNFAEKYRIPDPEDNDITLFKGTRYEGKLILNKKPNSSYYIWRKEGPDKIPEEIMVSLIEDILGMPVPSNYKDLIDQLSNGNEFGTTLFDLYSNAIGVVLQGVDDVRNGYETLDWNKFDNPNARSIKLTKFNTVFNPLQTFLGMAYGTNVSSVNRNSFGNNVAAYSLRSMIKQIPQLVLKMNKLRGLANSYTENPVYKAIIEQRGSVGAPITRIDVNINGKKKKARDLTESEVAYLGIMVDFWQSYKNEYNPYIEFQNNTFADKNTHFSIPYSKKLKIKYNVTLESAIEKLLSARTENEIKFAQETFEDAIFDSRKNAYQKILNNLFDDYKKVLFHPNVKDNSVDFENILAEFNKIGNSYPLKLDAILKCINTFGKKKIESWFNIAGVEFVEELHTSGDSFNETLKNNFDTYLWINSRSKFKNRINTQKEYFLHDLRDAGFQLNGNFNSNAVSSLINDIGSEWIDPESKDVYFSRTVNGNTLINPMLNAYFYSDVLLSNSYNDILFGRTFFHPNKYKPNKILQQDLDGNIISIDPSNAVLNGTFKYFHDSNVENDDFEYDKFTNEIKLDDLGKLKYSNFYYAHSEASRLSASYKRTVNAGATVHSMLPMKYGIDPNVRFAVMKDMKAPVYNMLGVQDEVDAWDGSGLSSPIQAILENWSLLDAAVGMDKKTIFGDTDARYGMPSLLKWAVFALTNDRRQMSMGSDVSAENLFKRMHSESLGKVINLSKYYKSHLDDQIIFHDAAEKRTLTHTNDIFRYDLESGKYYLIANLNQNGKTAIWNEYEVDEYGNIIPNLQPISRNRNIESIYDIDQVFGGAYCMALDSKSGKLEYSIVNNTITANIVCYENIKDKMVGYLVNKSAIKVGSRNVNSSDSWYAKFDDAFKTTQMSLQYGGVQMDADHDLKESDVTEMSQMISSLIQNGYFTNEVNQIYSEIGGVVANSLKLDLNLLAEDRQDEIHRMLGEDLIRAFSTGSKDTIGLAQSYLLKAAQKLAEGDIEVNIPFSDPSIFGAFVADVISNINKSGIRRRYAGAQAVLVPSRGMIQYYNYDGYEFTYNDLIKYLYNKVDENGNRIIYNQPILNYIRNYGVFTEGNFILNGEIHPFISVINNRDVDMGDYILYINPEGKIEEIPINTWENFDRVRNQNLPGTFYKWSIKPRDLRQSDTTFVINGIKYSIYDLDSVRASHYLDKLLLTKVSDLEPTLRFILENGCGVKLSDKDAEGNDEILTKDKITQLKSLANRQTKLNLKNLEEGNDLGYNIVFGDINSYLVQQEDGTFRTVPFIPTEVNTRFAEIIMGRLNAEQLGLQKNDSIAEIKAKGPRFFADRMLQDYQLGQYNDRIISKDKYEAVLIGRNGEKLFVALKSLHDKRNLLKDFTLADNVFESRNNRIFYKDQELCDQSTKKFYTKATHKGNINLLVVDNFEELDELLDSSMYYDIRWNYTVNNVLKVINQQYPGLIDENGIITQTLLFPNSEEAFEQAKGIRQGTHFVDWWNNIAQDFNKDDIVKALNRLDENSILKKLENQAELRYAAFLKQLQYVGARIPTQSMQSFMGLQLVGFTNSDTAEVYVPASQTWLQGSDYDIDKLYILGFEINKNGKLQTFSKLQNLTTDYDRFMMLSKPNGIKYNESDYGYPITSNDIEAINNKDYSVISKIIDSNADSITFENVSSKDKYQFLKILNKHTTTKLSKFQSEAALKNSIVNRIIYLLKHPRNQIAGHLPINMKDLQDLAKNSTLGNKEKLMTSDNPLNKFIMQVQNMVGRDVIGISAVGLKVFFATSYFINQRINDLINAVKYGNLDSIEEILNDIRFKDTLDEGWATLANVNFEPLIETLKNSQRILLSDGSYLDNVIDELNIKSQIIDGAESLSQLISAATDNAKELILAKINATVDFADAWSHLISTGHTIKEIGDLMMNPLFGVVSKYTKTDLFSDIISSGSPKNALAFVLGVSQLPGIDLRSLKIIMGSYRDKNKEYDDRCFIDKLLYETETFGKDRGKIKIINGAPRKRTIPLISEEDAALLLTQGSNERKNIFQLFSSITDPKLSLNISKILLDHINYLIKDKNAIINNPIDNEDVEEEPEMDYYDESATDVEYEPDYDMDWEYQEDAYQQAINTEDFDSDSKFDVSLITLNKLYRYINNYVIPKNADLEIASSEDIQKLKDFYENVIPAVEEQQINGMLLGVNQGIKTDPYKFYSRLKRVENFINRRVNQNSENNTDDVLNNEVEEPFNIIEFLDNSQYRKYWIDKMDELKTVTNPLKLIWYVPNFREMYKLNSVAYHKINHSIQAKLLFKLSDIILNDPTSKLNEEEFKILSNFIRDMFIINWLGLQNMTIKLPTKSPVSNKKLENGFPIYIKNDDDVDLAVGQESINIGTDDGKASYVRLFENWIVPYLKHNYVNNAFTRNITKGNKFSKTHNINLHHARLSMNTMLIDSSIATQMQYSEILNGFNKIADDIIPEIGLSIKNALFLYNLLVYKNSFAKNGFLRLLETVNVREDNAFINSWGEFISDLDAGKYQIEDVITVNEETGELNISPVLQANIKNLLYRLSFTKNAESKFGVKQEKDYDGAVEQLVFTDMFGNPDEDKEPILVKNPNANDWVMEMPVSDTPLYPKDKGFKPNYAIRYQYNSKEVVRAVTNAMIQKFGVSDIVQFVSLQDIKDTWTKINNGEDTELFIKDYNDFNRLLNSKAFIHNGKIWIIGDKLTNDSALHEILHIVCASMKFNNNQEIRKKYYDLLNQAVSLVKADRALYQKLKERYNSDYASDFKEELLVYKLTDMFTSSFKMKFNKYEFTDDVAKFTIERINNILETDIPIDTNPAKLGNTTLSDLVQLFKSKLVANTTNPLAFHSLMSMDQEIKTMKRILIKASEDSKKKNFIKYDC